MEWWLQLLLFTFGYITCRTFYFFRAANTAVNMLKASQLISLAILARALENFAYSKSLRLQYLAETHASDQNKEAFMLLHEDELSNFKTKSIQHIVDLHPTFFRDTLNFEDWPSAMQFLNDNQTAIAVLLKGKK